jgi:hypothetical protein
MIMIRQLRDIAAAAYDRVPRSALPCNIRLHALRSRHQDADIHDVLIAASSSMMALRKAIEHICAGLGITIRSQI